MDTSMSPAPSSRPGRMCDCRSITRTNLVRRWTTGGSVTPHGYDPAGEKRLAVGGYRPQEVDRHRRVPGVRDHRRCGVEDAGEDLRHRLDAAGRAAGRPRELRLR